MSLIFKHPKSGGELHQAGQREIPYIIARNNIDLIILAAQEFQPQILRKSNEQFLRAERLYVPMDDSTKLKGKQLRDTIKLAKFAANKTIKNILKGKNVLSTCQAGWNRSGLISGLALKKLTQKDTREIVKGIRKNRSIFAMSNPLFVKIIERN